MRKRWEFFIEEYLRSFNATQAAIAAGYSTRSARNQGMRMMTNDDIKAAIQERLAERKLSANEVLDKLSDQARGDMGDFLDITPMGFVVDLDKAVQAGKTHLIKRIRQHTVTTVMKDGTENESHTIEFELYDAQAALGLLGKHHKLFTDQNEINLNLRVQGLPELLDRIYGKPGNDSSG